jgi:hypothetical protein
MDGPRPLVDNVFIERLWRSLKYEDVYLKGYADGHEARRGIAEWVAFASAPGARRPHAHGGLARGNRRRRAASSDSLRPPAKKRDRNSCGYRNLRLLWRGARHLGVC